MINIFICYRREDSVDVTGRIGDRLREHFGNENVFTDVDIPLGLDFRTNLCITLSQCNVLLAVIGRDWLSVKNSNDELRLNDPEDFVRIEIETALRRDIPVIPLLVQGASIPQKNQLPESIDDLAFRNAQQIRPDPDFRNDVNRLVQSLTKHLKLNEPETSEAQIPSDSDDKAPPSVAPRSPVIQLMHSNSPWLGSAGAISVVVTLFLILSDSALVDIGNSEREFPLPGNATPTADITDIVYIPPDMVVIPDGTFMMGSETGEPSESPVHSVTVPRFELARSELTWAEWQLCEEASGCNEIERPDFFNKIDLSEQPHHPVVNVNIASVNEYITWIGERTGFTYRLPSEAEWEYAARAGSKTKYFWGDIIGQNRANCDGCRGKRGKQSTAPVGSFDKNPFGLNDVHGNVWEWTADCWHENYVGAPTDGSSWVDNCPESDWHPLRGGAWDYDPNGLRAVLRIKGDANYDNDNGGFRLARTLP